MKEELQELLNQLKEHAKSALIEQGQKEAVNDSIAAIEQIVTDAAIGDNDKDVFLEKVIALVKRLIDSENLSQKVLQETHDELVHLGKETYNELIINKDNVSQTSNERDITSPVGTHDNSDKGIVDEQLSDNESITSELSAPSEHFDEQHSDNESTTSEELPPPSEYWEDEPLISFESLKNECSNSIRSLEDALRRNSENNDRQIPTGLNNVTLPEHVKKVLEAIETDVNSNVINEQQARELLTQLNTLLTTVQKSIESDPFASEEYTTVIQEEAIRGIDKLVASMNELPEKSESLFTLRNFMIAVVVVAAVAAVTLFALSTMGIGPGVVGAGLLIASAFSPGGALAGALPGATGFIAAGNAIANLPLYVQIPVAVITAAVTGRTILKMNTKNDAVPENASLRDENNAVAEESSTNIADQSQTETSAPQVEHNSPPQSSPGISDRPPLPTTPAPTTLPENQYEKQEKPMYYTMKEALLKQSQKEVNPFLNAEEDNETSTSSLNTNEDNKNSTVTIENPIQRIKKAINDLKLDSDSDHSNDKSAAP